MRLHGQSSLSFGMTASDFVTVGAFCGVWEIRCVADHVFGLALNRVVLGPGRDGRLPWRPRHVAKIRGRTVNGGRACVVKQRVANVGIQERMGVAIQRRDATDPASRVALTTVSQATWSL